MTEIQIQHRVKKSKVRGKLEIHYRCPNCTDPLSNPIEEAGSADVCPSCGQEFVVPGKEDLREYLKQKVIADAEKERRKKERAAEVESARKKQQEYNEMLTSRTAQEPPHAYAEVKVQYGDDQPGSVRHVSTAGTRAAHWEYDVRIVREGMLGVILLGRGKISAQKVTRELNDASRDGWELAFQVTESRRVWFFWVAEAIIITFRRQR